MIKGKPNVYIYLWDVNRKEAKELPSLIQKKLEALGLV